MIKKNSNEGINNDILLDVCSASCYFNKQVAEKAYNKKGLALTAPDVIDQLEEETKNLIKYI
jgi:NAD(P)H-hydrate repair Nnr-like enzyme with NAD(P)H-hydrate dehydratase domain